MAYFGPPDLVAFQLFNAFYMLLIFLMGLLVPVGNLFRPSTLRDWLRRNVKQLVKFVAAGWL